MLVILDNLPFRSGCYYYCYDDDNGDADDSNYSLRRFFHVMLVILNNLSFGSGCYYYCYDGDDDDDDDDCNDSLRHFFHVCW